MQNFKQADLLINISLVSIFAVAVILHPFLLRTAYYIVGGWQIVSMIVHSRNGWFMKKRGARRVFHVTVLILLAGAVLGQLLTPPLVIFAILSVATPLLTIIYTLICYAELKELKSIHSFNLR